MSKSNLSKLFFCFFLIQFANGFCRATTQLDLNRDISSESGTPVNLGSIYVDIRNGFSLLPPRDCRILRNTALAPPPLNSPHIQNSPDIRGWEILRPPGSEELVRFVSRDEATPLSLAVYLLLIRQQMDIEKILQARCDFWRKYSDQAVITRKDIRIVNNCSAAVLVIDWRAKEQNTPAILILETIIQSEPDRFFLLVLKTPPDLTVNAAGPDQIMKAVTDSFICFSKTQEEQRWKQAKNQAQNLLAQMNFDAVKAKLQPQTCYRISRDGKDIGFYRVRENASDAGGEPVVEVTCRAFINNLQAGRDFARIFGLSAEAGIAEYPTSAAAAVYLEGRFILRKNLDAEQAVYQFICPDEPRMNYHLRYNWEADRILTTIGEITPAKEETVAETLKINRRIFLPFSLAGLLPRFLPNETGGEFVFMRYVNRALCHYALRLGEKVDLPQSPPNSSARYLLAQMGQQGPILEIWLDASGNILQLHADALFLQLSTADQISKIWPRQSEEWLGSAPAVK